MDLVIQKAVELGISCIVPLITDRCDLKLKKEASDKLDSQWKEMTNYWDAHETKDNKITLKPEFKDNSEDRYKFTNKVDFVNKRLHGIYNDVDKEPYYSFQNRSDALRAELHAFFNGYNNALSSAMNVEICEDIIRGSIKWKKE